MAGLILELDPASESTGTSLLLVDPANGWNLLAFDAPPPEQAYVWAQPVDADGDLLAHQRYANRTVTCTLRVSKSTAALLQDELGKLGQKVAKIARAGERSTLKVTYPSGDTLVFDLLGAEHGLRFDNRLLRVNVAEVTLTLPAAPFIRGAEETLADHTETTLPALVFSEAATVNGDASALVRMVVDEDQAISQSWLAFGVETNALYDVTQASAALFFEAEGRTALGGSATAAGPSGASGGGSNVMRNTSLPTDWLAVLSTQASGGGAHLSHVGQFRVYARVQVPATNTGTVSVGLEWGIGDFRVFTRNNTHALDPAWEGTWRLVDLGLVNVPKVLTGTQRWEGRVIAKSTVLNDDLDVDYVMLVPTSVAWGVVRAVDRLPAVTAFTALDAFDQSAGTLATKTLPIGGTWAAAGDADDFSVNNSTHVVERTAVSDTGPHFSIAGTTTATAVAAQATVTQTASINSRLTGLFARYTDTNNFLRVYVLGGTTTSQLTVDKVVAGVSTTLQQVTIPVPLASPVTLRVRVTGGGRVTVWTASTASSGAFVERISVDDSDLATGGTLATGKFGLYDFNGGSNAGTGTIDDFSVWVPPEDAAMFASQSLQIRYDGVIREDSAGAIWQPVSDFQGDLLRLPAAGREGRTSRVIVKACRNDPTVGPDPAIDDISARLFVQPRYLNTPA